MDTSKMAMYLEFRPAWHAFSVYFFGVVIFFVGPAINPEAPISPALSQLLGTCFAAFIVVKRFTNLYKLEADKVVCETSFPKHKVNMAIIKDINRIDLRRGLTQRALKVAHVHLYVDGNSEPAVKLFGVPQPDVFRDLLVELGARDQKVTGAWRR